MKEEDRLKIGIILVSSLYGHTPASSLLQKALQRDGCKVERVSLLGWQYIGRGLLYPLSLLKWDGDGTRRNRLLRKLKHHRVLRRLVWAHTALVQQECEAIVVIGWEAGAAMAFMAATRVDLLPRVAGVIGIDPLMVDPPECTESYEYWRRCHQVIPALILGGKINEFSPESVKELERIVDTGSRPKWLIKPLGTIRRGFDQEWYRWWLPLRNLSYVEHVQTWAYRNIAEWLEKLRTADCPSEEARC